MKENIPVELLELETIHGFYMDSYFFKPENFMAFESIIKFLNKYNVKNVIITRRKHQQTYS